MNKEMKFDIGHKDVVITATRSGIRASFKRENGSETSIGLSWPPIPRETVELVESLNGKYYYPVEVARAIHGFWLSTETYGTEELCKEHTPDGIFGKAFAAFKNDDGSVYYRSCLYFAGWDIKSSKERVMVSRDDPRVFDYVGLVAQQWEEDEAKFNSAIAFTGRTARELMEIIKPLVDPEKGQEPPAIKI